MNKAQRKDLTAQQTRLSNQVTAIETLVEALADRETKDDKITLTKDEYVSLHTIEGAVEDVRSQVEGHAEDEQDKYDNMPESLQGGDKGDTQQSIAEALESAKESLESIESDLADHVKTDPTTVVDGGTVDVSATLLADLEEALSHLEDADGYIDEATSA